MNSKQIIELEKKYIMQTYGRYPFVVDKGLGCYLFDKEGKKYLDLVGGLATASIGHGNKGLAKAISEQAEKLINITGLFYTEPQVILAEKLAKLTKLGKCFFSNSGTEANEAAIKLARAHTKKIEIIATKYGFHGRTFGSLAATWKEKIKQDFKPLVPGFIHVEYNDPAAIDDAITSNTAAVMVEPIQGEAGINIPDKGYLENVGKICKEKNVLLILDEVQSGCFRTGKFLASQYENVEPDMITLAKGLANGIPIGVTIAKQGIDFEKGQHGSTFGGNNLSCTAASFVIDYVLKNKLDNNAKIMGDYFIDKLKKLDKNVIKEIRGKGLLIGVELNKKGDEYVNKAAEKGLLINCANEKVLRFLPPLIINKQEIDSALKILDEIL